MSQPDRVPDVEQEAVADTTGVFCSARPTMVLRTIREPAFVRDMEREMRSALGAVLGFAELLATEGHERLTERQQTWVDQLLAQGHLLRELVEGSFVLSRSETNRLEGVFETHDASRFVEHIVRGSQWEAAERKVEVIGTYATEGKMVADRALLSSALRSALSSMIRAAGPHGRVAVQVRTRNDVHEVSMAATPERAANPYNFSEVLTQTWERVARAHGGSITLFDRPGQVLFRIPAVTQP